jgi:hypothetical protein
MDKRDRDIKKQEKKGDNSITEHVPREQLQCLPALVVAEVCLLNVPVDR